MSEVCLSCSYWASN